MSHNSEKMILTTQNHNRKTTLKEHIKKILGLSGYTIRKLHVEIGPQQQRPVQAKHFFDLYFSLIDPHNFTFIQLGANDGKTVDIMHDYIAKYSLHGILVEPQKDIFEKLKNNYKSHTNLILENVAIAEQNGKQTIYKVKKSLITDANYFATTSISSLDKETIKRSIKKRIPHIIENISDNLDDYIEESTIDTITFSELMNRNNLKQIDFLFMDCDGYDGKIIKSIDFNTYSPKIINYESCVLSNEERAECEEILESNNYYIFRHGNDTCAFKI